MEYLTPEQVLFIHARAVTETGGTHGVLDLGLLLSAVARPQATFAGEDLYPDVYMKSAALLESLVGNHAFVDGNKRTAISAVGLFLIRNGILLTAESEQLEAFTLQCAQGKVSLDEMAAWLAKNSQTNP